jgi:hypothetical protein
MPKIMTIIGIILSALMVLVFGVDLAFGIPFLKASMMMDITFIICGGVLGFLSFATMREQV